MKKHFVGIAIIASFLGLSQARGQASAESPIQVVGKSEVINKDFARARKQAIENAMISGIVQVSQEFFDDTTFLRVQDIVALRLSDQGGRWVKDYRLLSEKRNEETIEIELMMVPLRTQVRQALIEWGILFDRAKRPSFYVDSISGTEGEEWAGRIRSRLRDLGFFLAPVSHEADVWVSGNFLSESQKNVSINLEIQMKSPPRKFPSKPIIVNRKWSPSEAAGFLATALLHRVLPPWNEATGGGRLFEIEVTGFHNNLPVKELRKVLNSGEWGFSEGKDSAYSQGSVVFQTVFDGEIGKLVKTLSRIQVAGNPLKVVNVKDRKVWVEIVKP